jgi:hypothetical protein
MAGELSVEKRRRLKMRTTGILGKYMTEYVGKLVQHMMEGVGILEEYVMEYVGRIEEHLIESV